MEKKRMQERRAREQAKKEERERCQQVILDSLYEYYGRPEELRIAILEKLVDAEKRSVRGHPRDNSFISIRQDTHSDIYENLHPFVDKKFSFDINMSCFLGLIVTLKITKSFEHIGIQSFFDSDEPSFLRTNILKVQIFFL